MYSRLPTATGFFIRMHAPCDDWFSIRAVTDCATPDWSSHAASTRIITAIRGSCTAPLIPSPIGKIKEQFNNHPNSQYQLGTLFLSYLSSWWVPHTPALRVGLGSSPLHSEMLVGWPTLSSENSAPSRRLRGMKGWVRSSLTLRLFPLFNGRLSTVDYWFSAGGSALPFLYGFGNCKIIPPPCPDSTVGNCPFHFSISAREFSIRRKSSNCGVSEFCRIRLAFASPSARVTMDFASPSASAIFFAASACVVASSLRARSACWMACALAVMAVAITAGTRGAPK